MSELVLLTNDLLTVRDILSEKFGIYYPDDKMHDLEKGINASALESGYANPEGLISEIISNKLSKEDFIKFASSFTIGETYFFREKKVFEALETVILPELIRSKKNEIGRAHV